LNRPRRRAPNLRILDRLIAGFCSLWIRPKRHRGLAIAFKPSTFLNFHRAMVQRKYRVLFSPKQKRKAGPKGPTADLIRAVIEMKRRNPSWGSPQIAEQINLAFGTCINKDVVRRILATQYSPTSPEGGPSWLTFIGHMKDSLWSLDLFRCESIGCWSSWTSTHDESSDSGSSGELSMAWHSVECSSKRYEVQVCRSTSAPITIRCTGFMNGRRTFEFWT